MRYRYAAPFLLAAFMLPPAGAQQPAALPDASPLAFVKIAAPVAANAQGGPLDGYLAIYIDQKLWPKVLGDADLGPFLKAKGARPGRTAALFYSGAKDLGVAVYFDGQTPAGVAVTKRGKGGKFGEFHAEDVAAAYKPVTKNMLKRGGAQPVFTPDPATTDDGDALPAFQVGGSRK